MVLNTLMDVLGFHSLDWIVVYLYGKVVILGRQVSVDGKS